MPKRQPDEVTPGTDHLEKLSSAIAFYMDRLKEERIRRLIIGPLFELGGIPERELNKMRNASRLPPTRMTSAPFST